MRRRIRLTGRRQLSRSSVAVKFASLPDKRLLTFSIRDKGPFRTFPADSKVSLRLHENKLVELVDLGTLASPKPVADFANQSFVTPSCQLRVVAPDIGDARNLLLGSTDTWTLRPEDEEEHRSKKGILLFQPAAVAPRVWKLDIREDDYPVVYIDERIPDPRTWARTDPVFLGAALPAILFQVFEDILEQEIPADTEWMNDWLRWADLLMPGKRAPAAATPQDRRAWIEDLIDSFCSRHRLSDLVVARLTQGGAL